MGKHEQCECCERTIACEVCVEHGVPGAFGGGPSRRITIKDRIYILCIDCAIFIVDEIQADEMQSDS